MNYYQIFYWLTVADGVKKFFDVFSNIMVAGAITSFIFYIVTWGIYSAHKDKGRKDDNEDVKETLTWLKNTRRCFFTFLWMMLISWSCYVFIPSKKDALIIIAGGTVGNFITHDTAARQIPSEVMNMLRAKIQSEINSASLKSVKDTLADKSAEELRAIIRNK